MKDYPVSLRLAGLRALVVGGGHGTARRVQDLLAAGARVHLCCSDPDIMLSLKPDPARFIWSQRGFLPEDLEQVFLVVSCPGNAEMADAVWQVAKEKRVLINTVDNPALSNFAFPAIWRQGDLSVSIATRGKSPAFAVLLRDQIGQRLGPEYGVYLDLLGEVRSHIKKQFSGYRNRLKVWQRVLAVDVLECLRNGNVTLARQKLLATADAEKSEI